jgi:hypothetical protein
VNITEARSDVAAAKAQLQLAIEAECPGPHKYVQHRDAKPPWCEVCGYTAGGFHRHELNAAGRRSRAAT